MHRFPRQTSSGGNSSDATTPTSVPTSVNTASGSIDATAGSQTSILTTAAGQLSPSLTSSASSSNSAGLTTSSTLTDTSTSPSPSTSPSSNSVSSTTSHAATSSSITSPTTSSASSSVPSSITAQPPTSSSQQETTTIITSAYTTYINGSQILTSTSFPSTIPQLSSSSSSSHRTAIITGSAAGGTALIILILSFAFFVRRKRFKRVRFLDAITLKRKQARSRATLLDGEGLDNIGRPPHGYTDYETPWDGNDRALMAGRRTLDTPGPTLPSRWAETGSAFREEVWPPPNEATRLMDPLANRDDLNIDLNRIVDDVMGPSHTQTHFSDQSVSSMHRGSMAESQVHSRTASNASNAALLEAAGLGGAVGSASTAPVRPSPLAQQGTTPASVEDQGGDTL